MNNSLRRLWNTRDHEPATRRELAWRCVNDHPRNAGVWSLLADALVTLYDYRRARAALNRLRDLSRVDEDPYWLYVRTGSYFKAVGELTRAERWFRRAADLSAGGLVFLGASLADVLVKRGRFSEAAPFLDRAVASGPKDPRRAHYLLGLIARSRRRYREAIKHFDRALAHDRGFRRARLARTDAVKAMAVRNTNPK